MKSLKLKQSLSILIPLGLLIMVLLWLSDDSTQAPGAKQLEASPVEVSVIDVSPQASVITEHASGITMARWPTNLNATVSGRVEFINTQLQPGELITKGSVLVRQQNHIYKADLASAQARVANTQLEIARIKNEQYVASKSGKAQSAFGRFEPHLHAANSEYLAAKAAQDLAQQQLKDSQTVAPFDAVILSDHLSPGQWLNTGELQYQIAASIAVDIKVELSAQQWRRLTLQKGGKVSVQTPDAVTWPGKIRYLNPIMDQTTRQRSIVIEVLNPYQADTPLLPDQQVQVTFSGPALVNVIKAPASVITEDGKVWSLTKGKLQLEDIELLEEKADYLLYRYKNQPDQSRQLVLFPLSSMLQGQKATALVQTHHPLNKNHE
ncbi:MAG: RND family efflux transporter MFP subunit [Bermanella sp.]|jgi:RND family efflux transporter MFP subunit